MPKAILEFTIPEEDIEFNTAVNGVKYKIVLHEIENHLRMNINHNDKLSPKERKVYESVREFLYMALTEQSININN